MRRILLVGTGGFLGSVARYLVGDWTYRLIPFARMPYATMIVNVAGCLAIGFLGGLYEFRQAFGPDTRAFFMIGILGGFTTFSTFGYETMEMLRDAEQLKAFVYVAVQVVFGLAGVWLGNVISRIGG